MIVDLPRFVRTERPYWDELEATLRKVDQIERLRYAGLAGQMQWNRMRTLALALGNRGVKLAVLDPARIKSQVAEGYLEVKRRQLL